MSSAEATSSKSILLKIQCILPKHGLKGLKKVALLKAINMAFYICGAEIAEIQLKRNLDFPGITVDFWPLKGNYRKYWKL